MLRGSLVTLADTDVPAVTAALKRYRVARSELADKVSAWAALLEGTRTVFRAPSFAIFTTLLTGWVGAPGRRASTTPDRCRAGRNHGVRVGGRRRVRCSFGVRFGDVGADEPVGVD